MTKHTCKNCGHKWTRPDDVIDWIELCEICIRANTLIWQIYKIVGQDGATSAHYKLTIHPEVFKKFQLFKEYSHKPGKYNKTHIYKKNGKYGIKLQQTFFFSPHPKDSKLVFHKVDVILDKNIFWWYMEKVGKNEKRKKI